jgi:hypothetical protein
MRWLLLCSVIAASVIALTAEPSTTSWRGATRYGATYRACHCHFGYYRNSGACAPAVACLTEGGRCHAPCGSIYEPDQ